MEGVVHDGWLYKSPPDKAFVKGKWRKRWFVLRHSGLLPGQFILEYFIDDNCKKLRGQIDLDQCEQIDSGLIYSSKKTHFQYMFNIRTPKRIYFLVAETEADMNKWVQCICSVCGLKIHTEEDYFVPQENATDSNSVNETATNLTEVLSSSNPYIPISECHTGKPVLNGNLSSDSFNDLPNEPPPPPPTLSEWSSIEQSLSDELYDFPKPVNQNNLDLPLNSSNTESDDSYLLPPAHFKSDSDPVTMNDVFSPLPSKGNWNLSIDDSVPYCNTVPRQKSCSRTELPEYDIVPPFHGSIKDVKPKRSVQNLTDHFEKLNVKTSTEKQPVVNQECSSNYVNDINCPPRPPKPSKLRERPRYENFELPHQTFKDEDKNVYDIPPPPKGPPPPKPTVQELLCGSGDELSPSTKVPLSPSGNDSLMDDTYDFPKFRSEDNINTTVPLAQTTGTTGRPRRHAYTNAPPGLFNSKDLIFNYEYRPSLMSSDGYLSSDAVKSVHSSSDATTPPSPSAIGAYANVPTSPTLSATFQNDLPPAVNRDLKPKRVLSNEEKGAFSFLTLQPPPVCRNKGNKKSFRKPRAAPSPTPSPNLNDNPPIPNRFRHPDMSNASDDEMSNSSGSRRSSSNDDQARHLFSAIVKKDEIQYLDLDLDSEPSPSPKSPERMTASTVYKKVDFVKTRAFNEMRQNVEESYRKSQ